MNSSLHALLAELGNGIGKWALSDLPVILKAKVGRNSSIAEEAGAGDVVTLIGCKPNGGSDNIIQFADALIGDPLEQCLKDGIDAKAMATLMAELDIEEKQIRTALGER
jgi:hypothetical protein